jgi:hypothetical protein
MINILNTVIELLTICFFVIAISCVLIITSVFILDWFGFFNPKDKSEPPNDQHP